ncbi:unannotated protein [freshwater metagenome]|uniref:Unannotated protein n=1 Tax=freshwater metagenome TaxID=449393 RepID=A0A6J6T1D0_9ZZZZ
MLTVRPCKISDVERPGLAGSESTDQAAATSTRALGSATGRPPGRRVEIAPAASAPRSPDRRGIQANFAPDFSAKSTALESAPAFSLRRSPTKITLFAVNPEIDLISEINFAFSFTDPRLATGASLITVNARLRNCL